MLSHRRIDIVGYFDARYEFQTHSKPVSVGVASGVIWPFSQHAVLLSAAILSCIGDPTYGRSIPCETSKSSSKNTLSLRWLDNRELNSILVVRSIAFGQLNSCNRQSSDDSIRST